MEMRQLNLEKLAKPWEVKALCQIHQQQDLGGLANSGRILHYGCGRGYAIINLPNAIGYEPDVSKAQLGIDSGASIYWTPQSLNKEFDVVFCHEKVLKNLTLSSILPDLQVVMHRNSLLMLAINKHSNGWKNSKEQLKIQISALLEDNNYQLIDITEQYAINYRKMLFFYRIFGKSFYYKILNLLGRLKGEKRWIVKAVPKQ